MHSPRERRSELDGLRCAAALSVLVFHVWLFSAPQPRFDRREQVLDHVLGELRLGLYLFFVLSGFLLYGAWTRAAREGEGEARPRTVAFLLRRAARILPAYYVAIAAAALLLHGAGDTSGVALPDAGDAWLFAVLGQNYSAGSLLTLNSPTWTLAVEAAFYVLLPALGWLALRAGPGRAAQAAVPLAIVLAGLAYNAVLATGQPSLGLRLALPALLPHFGAGMLVAALVDGRLIRSRTAAALAAGGLALVVGDAAWHELSGGSFAMRTLRDIPAGAGFALVLAAVAGGGFGSRLLGARPLALAGVVSYGIYLWHVPLILALRHHGLLPAAIPTALALVLVLALAAGAASWRLVEAPALRWAAQRPLRVPRRVDLALAAILVAALALRLRNIDHGLPLVLNFDENQHFVRPAMAMFETGLNPQYFQNPSALTDLYHAIFRIGFRQGPPFGESGLLKSFHADPTTAFVVARVTVALLGTLAVALVYRLGARCCDRRVGLLAAALLAFAFLPYQYSTLALPDGPLLAAVAAATLAAVGAWERGRLRDFAVAGAAVGLAVALKYLALPLLAAVVLAALLRRRDAAMTGRAAAQAVGVAATAAMVVFLVLNPFAVLDFGSFRSQVTAQAQVGGVLGQEGEWGPAYYAWTLTWGLGWVPIVAACCGLVALLRADPRRALLLAAFPLLLALGVALAHPRFYGRYLLGAYPVLCVLAGYGAVRLLDRFVRSPSRRWAAAGGIAAAAALCAQGLVDSLRVSAQIGREDTRLLAAAWFAGHVPEGGGIVLEPFTPARLFDVRRPGVEGRHRRFRAPIPKGTSGSYTRYLAPAWVERYRREGFCWVVVTSYHKQRALTAGLAGARAYYARLDAASAQTTVFSPYRRGTRPVAFSYDATFSGLSRAFVRPGPVVEIHRLRGCAGPPLTNPRGGGP